MTLQKLPTSGLDDINHRRRHREITNSILDFSFDDSRIRTAAEIAGGVTVVNSAYPPGDVRRYGTNTTPGTSDMTAALQAAHDQGKQSGGARPFLPGVAHLITTAIDPCRLGMYGEGSQRSRIVCNNCNGFTIPSAAGWDRPQAVFEQFGIDSNDGTSCDDNWAFYFGGVATNAAAVYNSGFVARDLAIGRNARMGGAFYLKDVFSANVSNISMTDVSRGVQLVGSVVQCTFENISAFGDNAGTTLDRYGFSTESATYSGSTTLTPEHITTRDCSWIVFNRGLSHTAGLDCNFYDTDVQTTAYGYFVDAPCEINGGVIIPHSSGVGNWTGIFRNVNGISDPKDASFIENVDITVANTPGSPSVSYGIDLGDNSSNCYGVIIKNCRIKGNSASLQNLIRGRILIDCTIEDCVMQHSVAASTDVLLTNVNRLWMNRNRCSGGTFSVNDNGNASAEGSMIGNYISTLTQSITTTNNWIIDNNNGAGIAQPATNITTFTATETGCTTSPTGTIRAERIGRSVRLDVPAIQGTSNASTCTLTGMPSPIRPNADKDCLGRAVDNGANGICGYRIKTSGTIELYFGAALAAFTNSGTKGSANCTLFYSLD